MSVKDEKVVSKDVQRVRDSQPEPHRLKSKGHHCCVFTFCGGSCALCSDNSMKLPSEERKVENLEDHCYAASPTLADHQYASHGPLWFKECDALQDELVSEIPLVASVLHVDA